MLNYHNLILKMGNLYAQFKVINTLLNLKVFLEGQNYRSYGSLLKIESNMFSNHYWHWLIWSGYNNQ